MARKSNRKSNRRTAAPTTAPAATPVEKVVRPKLSPEERTKRHQQSRVTAYMRRNEDTFKAVGLVLDLLVADKPESERESARTALWSTISRHDAKYFQHVYKRRRNASNPLRIAKVKRPSTAYAFFTQEMHTSVKGQHPNVEFGDLSKIIRKMWTDLSADKKQRYIDLAAQDNTRYHKAKAHVYGLLDGSIKAKSKSDKELLSLLQSTESTENTEATKTASK